MPLNFQFTFYYNKITISTLFTTEVINTLCSQTLSLYKHFISCEQKIANFFFFCFKIQSDIVLGEFNLLILIMITNVFGFFFVFLIYFPLFLLFLFLFLTKEMGIIKTLKIWKGIFKNLHRHNILTAEKRKHR